MRHPIAKQWIEGWGPLSLYTGLSEKTLRAAASRGDFRVIRLSPPPGPVRFLQDEIDEWLEKIVGPSGSFSQDRGHQGA